MSIEAKQVDLSHRVPGNAEDSLNRALALLDILGSAEPSFKHENLYRFTVAIMSEIIDAKAFMRAQS